MQAWTPWIAATSVSATLVFGLPLVVPPPAPGDSGDTGAHDTADTADSADTADTADSADSADTSDTADTGLTDPIDTSDSGDSADTAVVDTGEITFPAAFGAKEEGGFGCTSVTAPGVGLLWLVGLGASVVRRRRSD